MGKAIDFSRWGKDHKQPAAMIDNYDTLKLRAQASVLKDVAREYPGRTIENVISNIEARIKAKEERQ